MGQCRTRARFNHAARGRAALKVQSRSRELLDSQDFHPRQCIPEVLYEYHHHRSKQQVEDQGEPPRKRRKVGGSDEAMLRERTYWQDPLTLAVVKIDLDSPVNRPGGRSGVSLDSHTIESASLEISRDGESDECDVRLYNYVDGRTTFTESLTSKLSPDTIDILLQARSIDRLSNKRKCIKSTCRIAYNEDSRSEIQYKIEIHILWRNSVSLDEARTDSQNDCLTKFALGIPKAMKERWSPRDFYESVHVPVADPDEFGLPEIDGLVCELYPFQKRTVQWLLRREGMNAITEPLITPPDKPAKLPHGFLQTTDAVGRKCYVSHLLGIMTTSEDLVQDNANRIRGGILAEEMGLGKTVEVISLILLHRRMSHEKIDIALDGSLRSFHGTLIISPPSILHQWQTEIQRLAPALKVMIYQGTKAEVGKADDTSELLERILDQDIILTTYSTLAREIHYSGAAPDRDLRHAKKYERRQSPLTQIDWWRVVLDECQMIESGVSNAAKVAELIPRQNAWAVSGTPMKNDAKDLLGLLIFLRYRPYSHSDSLWNRLVLSHRSVFKDMIGALALRHTKEQVKGEIQLPPQKRVVLTIPFSQIEEQHYSTLYQQMCEDCGLDIDGAPLSEGWDPEDPNVIENMRIWLARLRQTCLHPEVGDRNRRALGHGDGPLRTVGEVLKVMMEQNDTASRAEERSYILSQIRRGQILEHAEKTEEAQEIWLQALSRSKEIVLECRQHLQSETKPSITSMSPADPKTQSDDDSAPNARTGLLRMRLRSALELEHTCTFFVANAYYQIKTNDKLTDVDSDRFKKLEKVEEETYEKAKQIRNEILIETRAKAEAFMQVIRERKKDKKFTTIDDFTSLSVNGGIESRKVIARLDELCYLIDNQARILSDWREKMIDLLLLPLVDQEDSDLKGDEYEESTKRQDDMYVYMEALRALVADRHDCLTGQRNVLIEHEMAFALNQARQGAGHNPELAQRLLSTRSQLKPKHELGSIRGVISELRALKVSLQGPEDKGIGRTGAEISIINNVLDRLQLDASKQAKIVTSLERDMDIFKDTQNARLEYYRQLQSISDTVAPYEEELDEFALKKTIADMLRNEEKIQGRMAALKGRGRYLVHLRDESTAASDTQRLCIICQQSFEVGAFTSCGHTYCKDCLRLWWNAHRNCPTCKKHLSRNDFVQITYKPQELTMQEELYLKGPDLVTEPESASIYSGISSTTLNQIKNIDVDGSFGTKIDTLARHILWIRENDPGAKSIIFSQFRDFLDILARAFSKFKISFTSIDNKNGVEKFRTDPSVECFFLHAKAHSSGLNLVNATHVFLCEPLINTAIELQAIARVHRIGQHHPTTVWMYLVEDTVEKAIYDISVTRRLAHISGKNRTEQQSGDSPDFLESQIEVANSMEMEQAPLSKLLTKGPGGGELVEQDDLWSCLFRQRATPQVQMSDETDRAVTNFLSASAAEERRRA